MSRRQAARRALVEQNKVFDAAGYGRDHLANALQWMQLILASDLERSRRRIESRARRLTVPS
jgi:hypothetical protein